MLEIESEDFKKYGYVLRGDYSDVVSFLLEKSPMPKENNLYVRDDEAMRDIPTLVELKERIFGLSETENGYCNGYNSKLNCLEYHASVEVDIAATDLVLLLALPKDIKDGVIDSKDVKAFYVKKGTCVVLNPFTLHFSPCKVSDDGFKCAIILPMGTNRDLPFAPKDKKLWKENKWLFAHENSKQASLGAYVGIIGDNIEVNY
ncbi:MAG: DUF4867 family protein [Bacilli bacterium]|nr:DUF4867 family protein [Bacilli bacterium]